MIVPAEKFADFRRHKSVQIEPVVIPQRIKLSACDYVPFLTCVHSMFCTLVRRTLVSCTLVSCTLVPRGQFFIIRSVVQFTFSCAPVPTPHGGRWRARTYGVPALCGLLATCVVFWSHRRRDIVYTAVMFSPESMYITLDCSACTSYPSLKRHKYIWRFCKATGFHDLSSFLLS